VNERLTERVLDSNDLERERGINILGACPRNRQCRYRSGIAQQSAISVCAPAARIEVGRTNLSPRTPPSVTGA